MITKDFDSVFEKIKQKLYYEYRMGNIDQFLKNIGVEKNSKKKKKNFLIGECDFTIKKVEELMEIYDLRIENVEIVNDYSKIKKYNFKKFLKSDSDTIVCFGPIPHKVTNLGKYNSIISKLEKNSDSVIFRASDKCNRLKMTVNSLHDICRKIQFLDVAYEF